MLVTIFANTVRHVLLSAKIDVYTASVTNLVANLVCHVKKFVRGNVNISLVPSFVANLVIDQNVTKHVENG
jgi:hypothetical protein